MPLEYKLAVFVHVFAAVIWVGGVLFIAMVAMPAGRFLGAGDRAELLRRVGERFRVIGWSCIAVLLATGIYMMWVWGATFTNVFNLTFFSAPHTQALGIKLLFVLLMLIVSGIHDWYIGPKALSAPEASPERERLRNHAATLGKITGALVIFILICAIFVARPWM